MVFRRPPFVHAVGPARHAPAFRLTASVTCPPTALARPVQVAAATLVAYFLFSSVFSRLASKPLHPTGPRFAIAAKTPAPHYFKIPMIGPSERRLTTSSDGRPRQVKLQIAQELRVAALLPDTKYRSTAPRHNHSTTPERATFATLAQSPTIVDERNPATNLQKSLQVFGSNTDEIRIFVPHSLAIC